MLDPDADPGRRAWLPCPRCCDDGCSTCAVGSTCDLHWRYLLANETRLLFLQCAATCTGGGTIPNSAWETTEWS
jgi:hypothetical protein